MKKLRIVFTILLSFCVGSLMLAQSIDIYSVSHGNQINFSKIDQQTGSVNRLASLTQTPPTVTVGFSSVFDHTNRRFLFLSQENSSSQYHFNRFDVASSSALPSSVLDRDERVHGLEYDLRSGELYGLRFDSMTSQVYIASVNPQTGKIVSEKPVTGTGSFTFCDGECHPTSAFDPQRGIYIFLGFENGSTLRLYRVYASTGQVISSPAIASVVFEMHYDVLGDALYGIRFDNNLIQLVEIDVFNANQQPVKYLSNRSNGFYKSLSSFDQQSQTYILMQHSESGGMPLLTFYNAVNDEIDSVSIDKQVVGIEADNSSFASSRVWPSSVSVEPLTMNDVQVFPNPVADRLRIETSQPSDKISSVSVRDMAGKEVFIDSNLDTHNIFLDVSLLPKGVYHLKVMIGNRSVNQTISVAPR